MDVVKLAADELWAMFRAEGGTLKGWSAWLDKAKAHRPRLKPIALGVKVALRDAHEAKRG